jgi:hypothetical protein
MSSPSSVCTYNDLALMLHPTLATERNVLRMVFLDPEARARPDAAGGHGPSGDRTTRSSSAVTARRMTT